jgi:hypothetical protein
MQPLEISQNLFDVLDARNIHYVQWKSNEHLMEALAGETDLDLLVSAADSTHLSEVLSDLRFVMMTIQKEVYFPGRSGYLGFDGRTGSLIHLDVHEELILGEQHVKNHHLPLESWLLDDTRNLGNVRVPAAGREFLLLFVRVVLKTTNRQRLRSALIRTSVVPRSIQNELDWLNANLTDDEITSASMSADIGVESAVLIEFRDRAMNGRLDWKYMARAKSALKRTLRRYRRESSLQAFAKKAVRRLRASRPMRKVGLGILPKTLDGPGSVIALVGADGSGKTRLAGDLESWLSWKLRVRHMYFGQPKSGVLFRVLNKPGSMVRRRGGSADGAQGVTGAIVNAFETSKWMLLARKRRRMAAAAAESATSGIVMIAERYPIPDFFGMKTPIDGPRLQSHRPSGRAARYEIRQYEAIPDPTLLIVLAADLETLRGRKLDLTLDEHRAKVEAVQTLDPSPNRVIIDAGRPYPEVLLAAKTAIWGQLHAGR